MPNALVWNIQKCWTFTHRFARPQRAEEQRGFFVVQARPVEARGVRGAAEELGKVPRLQRHRARSLTVEVTKQGAASMRKRG